MDKDILKLLRSVMITSNKSRIVIPSINAELSYKKPIKPATPSNIQATILKNQVVLTWDKCEGATDYIIYLDGNQIGSSRISKFEYFEELNGNITILAYNSIYQSQLSEPIYIKTIPNAPIQLSVTTSQTEDGYEFTLGFIDNSEIETSYRLDYVIDDKFNFSRPISSNVPTGEFLTVRFVTPNIENKIDLKVVSVNELGENDLAEPIILFVAPTPRWTYIEDTKEVLLVWRNNVNNVKSYELKYEFDNNGIYHIETLNIDDGSLNAEIRHKIQLENNSILKIALCSRTETESHLYGKFLLASRDMDLNLTPPSNFEYRWSSVGVAEFSWTDIYNCEQGFEFTYTVDGGAVQTIYIPSTSIKSKGQKYCYTHNFGDVASRVSAKVRMIWELNTSRYTQELTATYYPASGLPPAWIRRTLYDDKMEITWEAQEFVEKYVLYLVQDNNIKTYESNQDSILINIDYEVPNQIELYIITHFAGGLISDKSKSYLFTPTTLRNVNNMSIYRINADKYNIDTKIEQKGIVDKTNINTYYYSKVSCETLLKQMFMNKFLLTGGLLETETWGKNLTGSFNLTSYICNTSLVQQVLDIQTLSMDRVKDSYDFGTTVWTWVSNEYPVYTEINKVRIVTLGDSITAGHPHYWAETGTGNEKSQYQYWLNRRLKGVYEILNKGYGSDTTDKMLARFDRDVLPHNAQYCIIQGGTNDLYWSMAEDNGNQQALDRRLQTMKDNMMEMVKRCWDNNIVPIVGTLIPRTGATGIYKKALYDYNEWIIDYCTVNENIFYIDFFNAGKEKVPPTPLEDPQNEGALNPLYDGDAIYDEYGQIIKQGRGIHPSPEGYRIMGDSIPLNIFKTYSAGLKLYLDEECTIEDDYDDTDSQKPFYTIDIDNIRRGKKKTIVRYVKNIGVNQTLFSLYYSEHYNLDVWFIDKEGDTGEFINGILSPDKVAKVQIEMMVKDDDNKSRLNLHLVGREIKQN